MGKYINPFTDWGFKRLFGQEFSKDLLISFLNDLLVDEMHIRDVTFKDKRAETCTLSDYARVCSLPDELHAKRQCGDEIQNRCCPV